METKMKMTKSQERAVARLKHEMDKWVGNDDRMELKEWNVKCEPDCRLVCVNAGYGPKAYDGTWLCDYMSLFIGTRGEITYYVSNPQVERKRLKNYDIALAFRDQYV